MFLKKFIKSRRKLKILFCLFVIVLILIILIVLNSASTTQNWSSEQRLLDERFIAKAYAGAKLDQPPLLKSPQQNGVIVPEKYDEHKIKARIIQDKIKNIRKHQQQQQNAWDTENEHTTLDTLTSSIHIFYSAPVQWYKTKKTQAQHPAREILTEDNNTELTTPKPIRILNTAFYPSLGLYKPTVNLLQRHFDNINNCGVGVIILSFASKSTDFDLYEQILELVPKYNLSVTFEISVAGNQSAEYLRQQLLDLRKFAASPAFYHVYSVSRRTFMPVIYVSNAYKLSDTVGHLLCRTHPDSLRRTFDAFFIGHIRLKNHAETIRRLCFDGFYSKLPSNGATFASTWKNWSYLKSFAITYKMLFVPTVGPGFAERNKFPRHGDIQRHRSNGRYYGVAWRTAIINHVGFINIASYNNWPDGSQIEEVIPKAGFLDYSPGTKTKYLDLTTHWVGNFLKTRQEAMAVALNGKNLNCYELLNNTIC
ncbi:glycoprotein endo-alpha-1,2-mannosidase-like protein [Teleopsis dalmanni]|uniref:glycoprotein endo-alpha-1,2-mannosidase-like protein n=1 Tax=Teleopsis dalmanni TaxID=139649 RepID=UPI0018CC7E52|nr:glycoprotein endo-alpha-1,2-mannosidase-like protein [Teleopsis dalmanni]